MRGLFINDKSRDALISADLDLLARRPGFEIMKQRLRANATIWLSPYECNDTIEFLYVLSGSVRILLEEGPRCVNAGESFYYIQPDKGIQIEVPEDTELLYITNKQVYDSLSDYQSKLRRLLEQVNDKDHLTYRHSESVMRCSLKLATKLGCGKSDIDNLVNASLFHDIGKCFIPDNILKKPGGLTRDEFVVMKQHPIYSSNLLEPIFGEKVAHIAATHHERLDGSGYPLGITGKDMSFEARIICVADSFDAMTTPRVYSKNPKSKTAAVKELCSMTDKYDKDVCEALKQLCEEGEMNL